MNSALASGNLQPPASEDYTMLKKGNGDRAAMTKAYMCEALDTPLDALKRALGRAPDATFIDLEGETLSFRELDIQSTRLAHSLNALGIGAGDTVVTIMETSLDVFVCWFAISKIGALWVPINLAYRYEFLRHQVRDARARLIICDNEHMDRVVEIADDLSAVERVLVRNLADRPACPVPFEPFDAYRGDDDAPLSGAIIPGDVALIIYTSGTTGPSKGCMLSHNYLCHVGRQQIRAFGYGPGDRTWTCLPLFHMTAITMAMAGLLTGNGLALVPRFSLSRFWEQIERSRATSVSLMATIFPLVAHAPDSDVMKRCFGQLKKTSGVPMTPELRKIWQTRFGVEFVHSYSYGLTEGARLSTWEDGEPVPPEGSCGRIASEFEVLIVDEYDRPVPSGEIGEIVYRPLRPHTMFEGYWGRPEDTLRVMRNMWMHTGDLGRLCNGYLYFCDRKKDYLRSRGENISSFEVENTLGKHPHILEVAVHSVGARAADDEIKVTVVLKREAGLTEEALCRWSIENLPHFAVPRYYEFRDHLPRNPTGKVQKFILRDEGITLATWDRNEAGIDVRRKR